MAHDKLDVPEAIFTDALYHNAKFYRDKAAVICGDERRSWAEFNRRTNKVANALLARGLTKGDKVCLLMKSSIPMIEMIFGVVKAGGVVVPLNVMMAGDSLAMMIDNSDARTLFADAETGAQIESVRGEIRNVGADDYFAIGFDKTGWQSGEAFIETGGGDDPVVEIRSSDSFNIIYSSGTTGAPKGIEHSHFSRMLYPFCYGPELKIDRHSVSALTTPLYTNGTWMTMLPTLYCGGTVVIMKSFGGKEFLAAVQRDKVTHAFLVPTQFIVTMAEPDFADYDTGSLEVLLCAGSPLAPSTFEEVREKFATADFQECYGQTEGFVTMIGMKDYAMGKTGSVGKSMFGGDLHIVDDDGNILPVGEVGEIAGYSPNLMKGYYKEPAKTDEIIWRDPKGRSFILSGDMGRLDEDGYLYVVGRKKDMIISGGINIFATDIEDAFMQHPEVSEVACIGIPHEKWGEAPLLLAIMKPDAKASPDEIKEWGNAKMGKFQRVQAVEFRDAFPRNALDKILKRELREEYVATG